MEKRRQKYQSIAAAQIARYLIGLALLLACAGVIGFGPAHRRADGQTCVPASTLFSVLLSNLVESCIHLLTIQNIPATNTVVQHTHVTSATTHIDLQAC